MNLRITPWWSLKCSERLDNREKINCFKCKAPKHGMFLYKIKAKIQATKLSSSFYELIVKIKENDSWNAAKNKKLNLIVHHVLLYLFIFKSSTLKHMKNRYDFVSSMSSLWKGLRQSVEAWYATTESWKREMGPKFQDDQSFEFSSFDVFPQVV